MITDRTIMDNTSEDKFFDINYIIVVIVVFG